MPISPDVKLGQNVAIYHPDLVNLYGCEIGNDSKIGTFVEIQKGAKIGSFCKVSSHSFICEGVTIEDKVFVGHGVMFINDLYPRSATGNQLQTEADWKVVPTLVKSGASLGSGSVILGGVTLGKECLIGAGAVVTKNVPDYAIVTGVPGKVTGDVRKKNP